MPDMITLNITILIKLIECFHGTLLTFKVSLANAKKNQSWSRQGLLLFVELWDWLSFSCETDLDNAKSTPSSSSFLAHLLVPSEYQQGNYFCKIVRQILTKLQVQHLTASFHMLLNIRLTAQHLMQKYAQITVMHMWSWL